MAGCSFQSVFHNPLVSPDILGVSYGSAAGAASAILLGYGIGLTQLFAFVGGIIAVSLTLLIAHTLHQRGTLILVLAGIVISGLFTICSISSFILLFIIFSHISLNSLCLFKCNSDGSFTPADAHSISYTSPLYSAVNKPLHTVFTKVFPPSSFS